MGVQGLLPLIEGVQRKCNVRELEGKVVGIDVAGWLYKGAYGCPLGILHFPHKTDSYVRFCLHRVWHLLTLNIIPVLVFDGASLPMKSDTLEARRKRKQRVAAEVAALVKEKKYHAARDVAKTGIDVTDAMKNKLIQACRDIGLPFVVAPHEADAQLAYLSRRGLIDAVITEDSDLLVFGATTVLFKMDRDGNANCVDFCDLRSISLPGKKKGRVTRFKNMTLEQFQGMCILSGCDYLPKASALHIQGFSLKTAAEVVLRHKTLTGAIRMLKVLKKKKVPKGFMEAATDASNTFQHQIIWDPAARQRKPLNPYVDGDDTSQLNVRRHAVNKCSYVCVEIYIYVMIDMFACVSNFLISFARWFVNFLWL
eukprot:m.291926 g.291926  ORF g.291926 m.291926 type:complete len:368 (-) comp15830_c0_seq11:2026-3129(-)